jgi:YrbI family 3-deoxy-D-manno-octulosonate 8-phosphate phosphatase
MQKTASVAALIPIRSGSKTIPDKNIKLFCGKPLVYWSATAALESGIFNAGVYIAVDSVRYADVVREAIPEVKVLFRPVETATDTASSESVLLWFVEEIECQVVSLIQATSPGVRPEDFREAWEKFTEASADSLLTGISFNRFLWYSSGQPINYNPVHRPRRQDMRPQILENGSFYFTKVPVLKETKSRLAGKIVIHEMHEDTLIEIDNVSDWIGAERIFRNDPRFRNRSSSGQKVIVVDVDGTLTDGGMYYGKDGEVLKKFNTRDGAALSWFKEQGFRVLVCTGEESASVASRLDKLGIRDYLSGVANKFSSIQDWLGSNNFTWNDVLYIGDELNDCIPMEQAAWSIAPADAHPHIRSIADYVTDTKGGEGVVRSAMLWWQLQQKNFGEAK